MLDSFLVPGLVGKTVQELGNDSKSLCKTNIDIKLWESYPHKVEYRFNERGYRDKPWPDNLNDCIWCFGDSFTLGLGARFSHTWPYILREKTKSKLVNISMNGASNGWMFRKIKELLREVQPAAIIVQWSYTHRHELYFSQSQAEHYNNKLWKKYYLQIKDETWPDCSELKDFYKLPKSIQKEVQTKHKSERHSIWFVNDCVNAYAISDEDRLQHYTTSSIEDDSKLTLDYIFKTIELCEKCQVPLIYGFIPNFALHEEIEKILPKLKGDSWGVTPMLDLARDRFHFDIKTSNYIVNEVLKLIK